MLALQFYYFQYSNSSTLVLLLLYIYGCYSNLDNYGNYVG